MAENARIPIADIDPPDELVRSGVDQEHISALADSIRAIGLLQPIGVTPTNGRFRLVFGLHRFLACTELRHQHIDARVLSADDLAELESAAAENILRKEMNPIEEAQACQKLRDRRGLSVRQLAETMGKSESWIRTRLAMLLWPEEIVAQVASGRVSPSVAAELVGVEDAGTRNVLLAAAVENGITVAIAKVWRASADSQAQLQASAAAEPGGSLYPPPGEAPSVLCGVCDDRLPVTAIALVKYCPACLQQLSRAKQTTPPAA